MKTKILAVVLMGLGLFLTGCSTTVPYIGGDYTLPASGNYKVLGRVSLETDIDDSGYNKLIDYAIKMFPDADDVVNIQIDLKKNGGNEKFIMSG